jgi:hypothetical protein
MMHLKTTTVVDSSLAQWAVMPSFKLKLNVILVTMAMAGTDNHRKCLIVDDMFIMRPILMKFGMDVVPLEAALKSYLLIFCNW